MDIVSFLIGLLIGVSCVVIWNVFTGRSTSESDIRVVSLEDDGSSEEIEVDEKSESELAKYVKEYNDNVQEGLKKYKDIQVGVGVPSDNNEERIIYDEAQLV